MKFYAAILFACISLITFSQSNIVYWDVYKFYVADKKDNAAYVEIVLNVNTQKLKKYSTKDNQYLSAVRCIIHIAEDSATIKKDTFIVKSPLYTDSLKAPDFIYIKRYWIKNNRHYSVKLIAKDYFDENKTLLDETKKFQSNFHNNKITFSDVMFIDTLEKTNKIDMFYRYGYSIIPYNFNYFNEYFNQIKFFCEIYNTDTIVGKDEPFIVKYYIQNNDNKKNLEQFGGFKKMKASAVNVLMGNLDIKELESGNYNLIIEIRNKNNELVSSKNVFFQRKNKLLKKMNSLDDEIFFGNTNNIDTLKIWLESLWPIANNLEKDWIINQSITKDAVTMKNFMIDFWEKRAADTTSAVKLAKEYYSKLNYVMKNFKCGKIAPYYTDRGRVYLQYGAPNQRTIQQSEPGAYPYEIWQYYRIYDAATQQFFTNRRFVFVNKGIADDCYSLIHSDMKGEFNNPNWQREIMKHDPYNVNDPYQQQKTNYGNNFDKLYQNPQ